jgi:hypothetical protein
LPFQIVGKTGQELLSEVLFSEWFSGALKGYFVLLQFMN